MGAQLPRNLKATSSTMMAQSTSSEPLADYGVVTIECVVASQPFKHTSLACTAQSWRREFFMQYLHAPPRIAAQRPSSAWPSAHRCLTTILRPRRLHGLLRMGLRRKEFGGAIVSMGFSASVLDEEKSSEVLSSAWPSARRSLAKSLEVPSSAWPSAHRSLTNVCSEVKAPIEDKFGELTGCGPSSSRAVSRTKCQ